MSTEVHKALREGQNKYTYFILAVAGAAIALSVNQTQDAKLSLAQIPLGIAVICWGLSFFFGCRNLAYVNAALRANVGLFHIQSGNDPVAGAEFRKITAASEGIKEAFEFNSEKANIYGHLQFRFLISGAVFYIGWHILKMYLNGI